MIINNKKNMINPNHDNNNSDNDNDNKGKKRIVWWMRLGGWLSVHLAILPFVQGCMFSLGFYLAKLQLMPLLKLTNNNK